MTRMHSSRMRTARFSGRLYQGMPASRSRGCLPSGWWGVCLWVRGWVSASRFGGVSASGSRGIYHTPFTTPPFTTPLFTTPLFTTPPFHNTPLSPHTPFATHFPFTTPLPHPMGRQTPVKTLPCSKLRL